VTKPELGIKRTCSSCGAKFYDLHKDPIVCPKCASVFIPAAPAPMSPRWGAHRWPAAVEKAAMPESELASPKQTDEAVDVTEDATSVETLHGAAVLVDEEDADEDVGSIVDESEKDEQA
jgi:uncharacterized protein (TIGR02300 family)